MMRARLALLAALTAVACGQETGQPLTDECNGTIFEVNPIRERFGGQTMTVALHQAPPFIFYDKSKNGNERFSGVTVDLLTEIGKVVEADFSYTIDEQDPEPISPAIDAVKGGTAEIAAGAIRITSNRSQEVCGAPSMARFHQSDDGLSRSRVHGSLASLFVPCFPLYCFAGVPFLLVLLSWPLTGALRLQVHFSLPFCDSGFQLVVKIPEESADIYKIFMPFHTSLWSVVGVEIFLVGWALYCMEAPHLTTAEESDIEQGHASAQRRHEREQPEHQT